MGIHASLTISFALSAKASKLITCLHHSSELDFKSGRYNRLNLRPCVAERRAQRGCSGFLPASRVQLKLGIREIATTRQLTS